MSMRTSLFSFRSTKHLKEWLHTDALPHIVSHTLFQHESVSMCLLCFDASLHLLTYFLHQKRSLQRFGRGLILCKFMQITVSQNSIGIGSMQIVFAKQPYWKSPQFPTPSHPTHPLTLFFFQSKLLTPSISLVSIAPMLLFF